MDQVQQNQTSLLALDHSSIHQIGPLEQEIEAQIIAHNDQLIQEAKELERDNDSVLDRSNSSYGSDNQGPFEEEREGEVEAGELEQRAQEEEQDHQVQEQEQEQEEEDVMEQEFHWEPKDKFYFGVWTPRWKMNFIEPSGPRNLPENVAMSPFEIFSLFFDNELIDLVTENTNIYAEKLISELQERNRVPQYLESWSGVRREEILALICAYIYMGIVKLPQIEDYWKEDTLFPRHIVAKLFSFRRFYLVNKFLHVSNVRTEDPQDKLKKIRPFFLPLLANWRRYYYPHEHITVDERMIKFTGRLSFKQYMKGKSNPFGIKAYLLADATNGYIYNMNIYTGKTNNTRRSSAQKTVKDLLEGTAYKGHWLFIDNYFTSIPLFKELEELMIGCSGTLRKNRKYLPCGIQDPQLLEEHETRIYKTGNLAAFVFMDRKPIRFLTNCQGGFTRCTKVTRDGNVVYCKPSPLVTYNRFKSEVDRSDQYSAYSMSGIYSGLCLDSINFSC